jgi:hypothetical protein
MARSWNGRSDDHPRLLTMWCWRAGCRQVEAGHSSSSMSSTDEARAAARSTTVNSASLTVRL